MVRRERLVWLLVVLAALLVGSAAVAFSDGGGEPVRVVWDGTEYACYPVDATSTPVPSVAPSVTNTATRTPTVTLSPSPTPNPSATPTLTPTATATAGIGATPTQENTLLSTLSATPPGPEKMCRMLTGSTAVQNLRVRTGPGINYSTDGVLAYNTEVPIYEAFEQTVPDVWGFTYVWARISPDNEPERWFAMFDRTNGIWWGRAQDGVSDFCTSESIPGWPEWLLQPPEMALETVCVGFHAKAPNVDTSDLDRALDVLVAADQCVSVKSVETSDWQRASVRGGYGVPRYWRIGDCADMSKDPIQEANRRANQMISLAGGEGATFIETDNECGYMRDLPWFNAYGVQLITRLDQAGLRVIFPSEGPGYWNEWEVQQAGPVWDAMLDTGACFGYHAYPAQEGVRCADSGIWLCYRHRQIRRWMMVMNPAYYRIPFCITEWGAGYGAEFYQSDFVDYNVSLLQDPYVLMSAVWTAGLWFNGFTINGWMEAAARALVGE